MPVDAHLEAYYRLLSWWCTPVVLYAWRQFRFPWWENIRSRKFETLWPIFKNLLNISRKPTISIQEFVAKLLVIKDIIVAVYFSAVYVTLIYASFKLVKLPVSDTLNVWMSRIVNHNHFETRQKLLHSVNDVSIPIYYRNNNATRTACNARLDSGTWTELIPHTGT